MPKNIVLCLDGTWNGPDSKDAKTQDSVPTNVQKIFEALCGSGPLAPTDNEKEIEYTDSSGTQAQVGKYIHGVGDTTNAIAKKVDGAVGLGLVERIVRGYTYLSREYQPGDRIYIVGFSRGAYTARALAGFVAGKGLLDWAAMGLIAHSPESYSAGLAAWTQYKHAIHADDTGILHALAESITDFADRLELGLHPAPELKFTSDVSIKAVGVWDTVGALGIPDMQERDGTSVRLDEFEFCDNSLSDRVENGFHAIAIDEQRADFTPTLWDARPGVVQVLFPGAHADVGGGYLATESGLSNCALAWMAARLAASGVLLTGMPQDTPNPLDVEHRPWADSIIYTIGTREFPPTLMLSQRVMQRIAAPNIQVEGEAQQQYRPKNILNSYVKLDWSGPAPHAQIAP